MTTRIVVRTVAATIVALVWPGQVGWAGGCSPSNLSSFSRLSQVVAEARGDEPGKLLAAWLLRPRDSRRCEFVFRIDLLLENGQIRSMNFDARTLEPVEIPDDRDWVEAGVRGESGEASDRGGVGSSSDVAESDDDDDDDDDRDEDDDDRDDDDRDDDDRDDDDRDDDNSGRGSSDDGDSDDGDSDDSDSDDSDNSGRGGGDDSDNSGHGGGDDSSGSGDDSSGGGDDSSGGGDDSSDGGDDSGDGGDDSSDGGDDSSGSGSGKD